MLLKCSIFNRSALLLLLMLLSVSLPLYADDKEEAGREFRSAAIIGDDELLETMLAEGSVTADNANRFGKTALMFAVESDNFETVGLLLNHGADVNKVAVAGCTALTFAAENGHAGITAMLLERGAHIENRTRSGWNALSIAAKYGYYDITEQLLFKGANPNAVDVKNNTALMHALQGAGDPAMLRLLVDYGANVDARNGNGESPLLMAVVKENSAAVKTLIELGASPNLSDVDEITPLAEAVESENIEIIQLLLESGSNSSLASASGKGSIKTAGQNSRNAQVSKLFK